MGRLIGRLMGRPIGNLMGRPIGGLTFRMIIISRLLRKNLRPG
jgi:hypothetical protein